MLHITCLGGGGVGEGVSSEAEVSCPELVLKNDMSSNLGQCIFCVSILFFPQSNPAISKLKGNRNWFDISGSCPFDIAGFVISCV